MLMGLFSCRSWLIMRVSRCRCWVGICMRRWWLRACRWVVDCCLRRGLRSLGGRFFGGETIVAASP